VTEAVVADVQVWQNRSLEEVYPIVYFDALWGKVRENGQVAKVAVYLALGITLAGQKEVLGMTVLE
jgi:putative transposase